MQPYCAVVTIPSAGSPVQLPVSPNVVVMSLLIKAHPANTGPAIYIGRAPAFDKVAGTDMIADINGTDQSLLVQPSDATNRVYPSQYWVDAAVSGDKALVTWWIG